MYSDSILPFHPATPDMPAPPTPSGEGRLLFGITYADAWLGGGLRKDGVHELYAASPADDISALGLALLLGWQKRQIERTCSPLLWLRKGRNSEGQLRPYGPGLRELGIDPEAVILLLLPDARAVLRAGLDAVRDGGAAAVLIELAGKQPLLDLTASRRLALAAANTGTIVLLVRSGTDPLPSAAHTRWHVTSTPSHALEADAPGMPCFNLRLLRHKGGHDGLDIIMEWDRDTATFREGSGTDNVNAAPLPRPRPALAGSGTSGAVRWRAA